MPSSTTSTHPRPCSWSLAVVDLPVEGPADDVWPCRLQAGHEGACEYALTRPTRPCPWHRAVVDQGTGRADLDDEQRCRLEAGHRGACDYDGDPSLAALSELLAARLGTQPSGSQAG